MKLWSQFYTPEDLSDRIVSLIDKSFIPEVVIDICAGSCNMLDSAYNKWPNAKYIAIDIENIKKTQNNIQANYEIFQMNSCNSSILSTKFNIEKKKLILANPPFGNFYESEPNHNKFPNGIEKLANKSNRIECHILTSNLSILKTNDYFGAVLPENFFTSERMNSFKNHFFSFFKNITIQDHKFKFERSEVQTKIFVGQYVNAKCSTIENPIAQIPSLIKERFPIVRGIDNSKLTAKLSKNASEVIHFNNRKGEVNSSRYISKRNTFKENQRIESKDLLVLRVGRSSGSVIKPNKKQYGIPISDLIFLLKNGNSLSKKKQILLQKELLHKRKGLTTKYISKNDIWETLNSIA